MTEEINNMKLTKLIKVFHRLILLSFLLLYQIIPAKGQISDSALFSDLDTMQNSVAEIHPNPFHSAKKKEVEATLKKAKKAIRESDLNKILVQFSKYMSLVGDGHTYFHLKEFHVLPIQCYYFDEGIFITNSLNKELTGSRIITLAGKSVKDLWKEFKPIIPSDNSIQEKAKFPILFTIEEYLKGLEILDGSETSVKLEVETKDRVKKNITLNFVSNIEYFSLFEIVPHEFAQYLDKDFETYFTFADKLPRNDAMLFTSNPGKMYWFKQIFNGKALYLQYNFVREGEISRKDFLDRVKDSISTNNIDNLIIDVRTNVGGNNSLNPPWIDFLKSLTENSATFKLYVIIGRHTFSAATDFVASCEKLGAVFVGEPTGGSPNHYGNPRKVLLPATGWKISISSYYWVHTTKDDHRLATFPNLICPCSANAYFNNFDPFIDCLKSKID